MSNPLIPALRRMIEPLPLPPQKALRRSDEFYHGEELENARLQPVLEALIEALELAEELIGIDEVNTDPRGQWERSIARLSALVEEK